MWARRGEQMKWKAIGVFPSEQIGRNFVEGDRDTYQKLLNLAWIWERKVGKVVC